MTSLHLIAILYKFLVASQRVISRTEYIYQMPSDIYIAVFNRSPISIIIPHISKNDNLQQQNILKTFFQKKIGTEKTLFRSVCNSYLLALINLSRIAAVSALVALSRGSRVLSVLPLISPEPTAYCIAGIAY